MTKLVGALAWPFVVGFVIVRFRPALKSFFDNLGEFSLKGGGFEASAKRQAAATALAAAVAARAEPGQQPRSAVKEAHEAKELVAEAVTPVLLRKAARARVLWVDDRPENNIYERQSMEALGVSFAIAKSTEEALEKLRSQEFDLVISDMGRPPDKTAGYTLLDSLRRSGNTIPFIIYASSNAPEHKAEARKRGALGTTNHPSELFEYVLAALWSKGWSSGSLSG
ncbi:MAG TPA: response regulator [Kofleriaceae bacterium]